VNGASHAGIEQRRGKSPMDRTGRVVIIGRWLAGKYNLSRLAFTEAEIEYLGNRRGRKNAIAYALDQFVPGKRLDLSGGNDAVVKVAHCWFMLHRSSPNSQRRIDARPERDDSLNCLQTGGDSIVVRHFEGSARSGDSEKPCVCLLRLRPQKVHRSFTCASLRFRMTKRAGVSHGLGVPRTPAAFQNQ